MKGYMKIEVKDVECEDGPGMNITVEAQLLDTSLADRFRLLAAFAEAIDFDGDELLAAAFVVRDQWDSMADEKIKVQL